MTMIQSLYLLLLCTSLALGIGEKPRILPTISRPWPLPQSEQPGEGVATFDLKSFQFVAGEKDCDILQNAFKRYKDILSNTVQPNYTRMNNQGRYSTVGEHSFSSLNVMVLNVCDEFPYLNMDEKYELKICANDSLNEAILMSTSIWGALRGLETFSQLIIPNGPNSFDVKCVHIVDFPRFPHRGVMLDTSRHYLPLRIILENLEIMAMNKFNVFHWHIVDDQSFPYVSNVYPDLSAKGAWTPKHIYTRENIKSVITYAKNLGIRVVVEFDSPGHTQSWGKGQPGLLTNCVGYTNTDGSTVGPIDPSREENFVFLNNLFQEISSLFPDHYIHVGGDEVPIECWQSNPNISQFMDDRNISDNYRKLEQYYMSRLTNIIRNLTETKGLIVWQEIFDNGAELHNDTIVQVWKYADNKQLYENGLRSVTAKGKRAILSACWYLNYFKYGVDWDKFYTCDPTEFYGTDEQKRLVIGGEACMWAEYLDKTNLISLTWPRASAVAEKLWSDRSVTRNPHEAEPRLEEHRCRLINRGYDAAPLLPSFCEGDVYKR